MVIALLMLLSQAGDQAAEPAAQPSEPAAAPAPAKAPKPAAAPPPGPNAPPPATDPSRMPRPEAHIVNMPPGFNTNDMQRKIDHLKKMDPEAAARAATELSGRMPRVEVNDRQYGAPAQPPPEPQL